MKNNFITITLIILILLLTSCASDSNKIIVNTPITLSSNDLYHINGEYQNLKVRMIDGKYYEDWAPGAYMGTIWEGDFVIELSDESGNVVSQTNLNQFYDELLIFNSLFQIEFDDYNNDGDIDFTIGQYASSNGRNYKIFTLRKDGNIEELVVKGYPVLFISDTTGVYSTKLTKIDDMNFKIVYYDNVESKNIEKVFLWDGNEFRNRGSLAKK